MNRQPVMRPASAAAGMDHGTKFSRRADGAAVGSVPDFRYGAERQSGHAARASSDGLGPTQAASAMDTVDGHPDGILLREAGRVAKYFITLRTYVIDIKWQAAMPAIQPL